VQCTNYRKPKVKESKNNDFQAFADLFDPARINQQFQAMLDSSVFASQEAKELMESQRKTMEMLQKAQQSAVTGAQSLAQRQGEMMQQAIHDAQTRLAELSSSEPAEAVQKNAEAIEQGLQQAMANFREISEMMQATYADVSSQVEERMQESLGELQDILEKAKK